MSDRVSRPGLEMLMHLKMWVLSRGGKNIFHSGSRILSLIFSVNIQPFLDAFLLNVASLWIKMLLSPIFCLNLAIFNSFDEKELLLAAKQAYTN